LGCWRKQGVSTSCRCGGGEKHNQQGERIQHGARIVLHRWRRGGEKKRREDYLKRMKKKTSRGYVVHGPAARAFIRLLGPRVMKDLRMNAEGTGHQEFQLVSRFSRRMFINT